MDIKDVATSLAEKGVFGDNKHIEELVDTMYKATPGSMREKYTDKYEAIVKILSKKESVFNTMSEDVTGTYPSYIPAMEENSNLELIEEAFYLTRNNNHDRIRMFNQVVEYIYETESPAKMHQEVSDEFKKLIQRAGIDPEYSTIIGREIYKTYMKDKSSESASIRAESIGILYWHRFIADYLMQVPDNKDRVHDLLLSIVDEEYLDPYVTEA